MSVRAGVVAALHCCTPQSVVASTSMPLPVSKGELNRLGDRLAESESPSEEDLVLLASALSAYQGTVELVKADLRSIGFSPTGRVKTTKTMVDKLRRTRGMQLSRMQDLAGTRITVRDFAAQDDCKDQICQFYGDLHDEIKIVDRRIDPRFGYRAVHLIARINGMLVEMQIRTELQDSWAQIFERLADRWGRGIRYGEDPENPEARVRSGNSSYSRRESVQLLMDLSDSIYSLEETRGALDRARRRAELIDARISQIRGDADPGVLDAPIPSSLITDRVAFTELFNGYNKFIDAECRELLDSIDSMSLGQFVRINEILSGFMQRDIEQAAVRVASWDEQVRATLTLVANAVDEGV
jgi:ppGpp synthetase/RelA/SpoT-type nucleotidyltranferase